MLTLEGEIASADRADPGIICHRHVERTRDW